MKKTETETFRINCSETAYGYVDYEGKLLMSTIGKTRYLSDIEFYDLRKFATPEIINKCKQVEITLSYNIEETKEIITDIEDDSGLHGTNSSDVFVPSDGGLVKK